MLLAEWDSHTPITPDATKTAARGVLSARAPGAEDQERVKAGCPSVDVLVNEQAARGRFAAIRHDREFRHRQSHDQRSEQHDAEARRQNAHLRRARKRGDERCGQSGAQKADRARHRMRGLDRPQDAGESEGNDQPHRRPAQQGGEVEIEANANAQSGQRVTSCGKDIEQSARLTSARAHDTRTRASPAHQQNAGIHREEDQHDMRGEAEPVIAV